VVTTPAAIVAQAHVSALRGTVVAVDEGTGDVLVRHAPFDGMPAMTMSFRLAPGAPSPRLGDAVDATVDERTQPWTLVDVRLRHLPIAPAVRAFVPMLREGDAVPAVTLVDQQGRRFLLPAPGVTTIVSFVYTRCRDARMCPLVAAKFARMQRSLGGTPVRLVTLTLDPAYDTPPVLARYGKAYAADPAVWRLATGTDAAIDELTARFGIALERVAPGVVTHSEAAIVIDARGRVAAIADGAAWAPDDLLAAARATAGLDANPLRRLGLWLGGSASALCGGAAGGPTVGSALALVTGLAGAFGLIARRAFRGQPS
jgi:protein SCO1/2